MSIEDRFKLFHAPEGFSIYHGIPLSWRFRKQDHPDWRAVYDPEGPRGFVFHLEAADRTELDVAFKLSGDVARLIFKNKVYSKTEDQERILSIIAGAGA